MHFQDHPSDTLPRLPNLGLLGPAFDEEVVARLLLAATTPPAFVRPDCLCGSSQIGADSRVAREELGISASDFLVLPLEVLPYFSTPERAVSSFGLDMSLNPAPRAPCLGLGCFSCQVGKAGLLEVVLVQLVRVRISVRHPLGVHVGGFVSLNPSVCRGPSYGERASPLPHYFFERNDRFDNCLARSGSLCL